MGLNHNRRMMPRLTAFFVWALLALLSTYWALKLFAAPVPTPAQALSVGEGGAPRSDLSRLLGQSAVNAEPQPVAESRFKLIGVVAPKLAREGHEQEGVALIAVDGGPARTVRVGALIDGETQLLSIAGNAVQIGALGQAAVTLTLMPLALASPSMQAPQPPATYALSAPMGQTQSLPPDPRSGELAVPPPRPQAQPGAVPNAGAPAAPRVDPAPNAVPLRQ